MLERGGPLLLVLDDLWSAFQLTELLGNGSHLPPGSQLLLTSRRSDVVASYNPWHMEMLDDVSASALLAWHSCGRTSLPAHLAEVGMDALRACSGLPLAIKVLAGALQQEPAAQEAWKVSREPHVQLVPRKARRALPGAGDCGIDHAVHRQMMGS